MMLARVLHDARANARVFLFAGPFKETHGGDLTGEGAPASHLPRTLFTRVHVARFAADVGLIHFDLRAIRAERPAVVALHREADPMIHEPRAFLRHANR